MKIQIKNRFNFSVIFECEAESINIAVKLAIDKKINLYEADLSGADLYEADLSEANLSRANLYGADLSWANLSRADLSWADLSWADLSRANLSRADLSGADLSKADLSGANLSRTDLSRAYLSGTDLYGEKIDKVPTQISGLLWWVNITKKHIQIGCQVHKAEEWFSFTDEEISEMHTEALTFWNDNKAFIKQAWEHHCK